MSSSTTKAWLPPSIMRKPTFNMRKRQPQVRRMPAEDFRLGSGAAQAGITVPTAASRSATSQPVPARQRGRIRSRARRRDARNALLFLAPWLFGFVVLQAYPLIMTVYYSFTNYNGLTFPPRFVGFTNFVNAFRFDPAFWTSVGDTVWWVVVSVPVTLAIGLVLALLLNRSFPGIGVYRTLIYLPS